MANEIVCQIQSNCIRITSQIASRCNSHQVSIFFKCSNDTSARMVILCQIKGVVYCRYFTANIRHTAKPNIEIRTRCLIYYIITTQRLFKYTVCCIMVLISTIGFPQSCKPTWSDRQPLLRICAVKLGQLLPAITNRLHILFRLVHNREISRKGDLAGNARQHHKGQDQAQRPPDPFSDTFHRVHSAGAATGKAGPEKDAAKFSSSGQKSSAQADPAIIRPARLRK